MYTFPGMKILGNFWEKLPRIFPKLEKFRESIF